MKKKSSLLYLINTTHIISGLSAFKTLHPNDDTVLKIIVHHPYVKNDVAQEIFSSIEEITKKANFIEKIILIPEENLSNILKSNNLRKAKKIFKKETGISSVKDIFYTVDFVGNMTHFLFNIYPSSLKVCFGDALGNVYEKDFVYNMLEPKKQNENLIIDLNSIKRKYNFSIFDIISKIFHIPHRFVFFLKRIFNFFKKKLKFKREIFLKSFKADLAVLILPIDQSGNFLKKIPLKISNKEISQRILNTCYDSAIDLNEYITTLNYTYKDNPMFLLLTENNAEGNFIDFDKEIEMYCEIIKKYASNDSVIFLKSHPNETLPRNEKIKEFLQNQYKVVFIKDNFRRYPIEIWKDFVLKCDKIVSMSYPSLSLKYLYNIDVIQPMDNAFIEKWFKEWSWDSYKNAIRLYDIPRKNLMNWDGKTILFSGK